MPDRYCETLFTHAKLSPVVQIQFSPTGIGAEDEKRIELF